ncbi:MAG: amidohydrolase family protein [Halioglobus sp.]
MRIQALLLSLITLFAGITRAQADIDYTQSGPLLLKDIAIIEGSGHLPYPNRDILIQGGKIARISVTSMIGELPKGTKTLDGKGLTVMPGLIDQHTHIKTVSFKQRESHLDDIDGQQRYLNATLYAGVTSIHELGGNMTSSIQLRDEINAGIRMGPTIYTVGSPIGSLKTTQNGVSDLTKPETMAEIKQLLDERQDKGIEIIKLYTGITPWEARHIMTEAKKRGMKGIADFWCSNMSKRLFMVTKIDGYAHGTCFEPLTRDEAKWMKDNNKFAMITFTAFDTMGGHRPYADYPDRGFLKNPLIVDVLGKKTVLDYYASFHALREIFEDGENSLYNSQLFGDVSHLVPMNYKNVRILWEEGVLVGLGTDAAFPPGGWPGEAMHFEMEHHVKAGIPNLEVIKFATLNNAKFLGIADQVGTVESGKIADLLVVRGNPAENISDTRNIAYVIKNGTIVDRAALRSQ